MTTDRVILVIGASSGIGKAIASRLTARNFRVYGTSRDASRVAISGVEALSVDVFDRATLQAAIDRIIENEGRLDGLVYSAGFYVAGAVEETSLQQVQDQLHAYFFAAVECAQLALPHMRAQGSGRLVFMSSTAGSVAIPFHAAYSASKGALGQWVDALDYELTPFGVHASYIEAGPIRTNAPNAMKPPETPMDVYTDRSAAAQSAFKASLAKGLRPEQIARTVVKALEDRHPSVRYRVGTAGALFPVLQALLPNRMFRSLMSRAFDIQVKS